MLRFIYGPKGSGKTEYIYDKIRENIKSGKKSFILVPEQASLDEERRMIKTLGISSQLWVEVLTFSRLCNMVFSEVGPLRLKYIDKAGKLFVAERTMQKLEKSLLYYGKNVHQRGFAKMTAKLISELKRYGVTPEMIREASEKDCETEFSKKLSDIALIYEEYNNLISGKYSDAEENLISAIPGIEASGLFEGEFFISGFKSFTPVEHLAITGLMKKADMTVSLCTDTLSDTDGIFSSSVYTYNKIKAEAEAEGIGLGESLLINNKQGANPELDHLKENYFKYPDNIYKEETLNISLITAKDSYDEVKKCAELISSLCREKGYKHRDFLILARNTESYKASVSAIFSEMGISCFINQQKSLSKNAFIRKVLAVAEILAYGFSYERIMPVVSFSSDAYTREEADIFENYVLASNVTHKYWNSKEDWTFSPDEERIDLETVNKVKRLSVNRILDLSESIKGRKTVGDICRGLLSYIKAEGLSELMAKRVDDFNQKGKSDRALEYTRAWNDFSSVISQMEQCMGDEFITYEKFYEIIREAFAEIKINIAPPLSDQVTFAEIDTFRKSDAKVVFVLGLADGVFPKGYIEEGMLSDIERDVLSEYGIELAPTADFKRREEQNLIYNVLASPQEMLFLSVPLGDKEGKAKIRSEIVDRVLTLFPNLNRIEEMDALPDSPREIFKTLLCALVRVKGEADKLSSQDKMIYDYFAKDEGLKEELKEYVASLKAYSPEEKLSEETAKKLYGQKLMLSVSKLEKYNSCAFAYFMNYGLFAKERLKKGFEANDTGSILHETLEVYLRGLKEADADYSKITYEELKRDISEIAKRITEKSDELLYETSPYYRYVAFRMIGVATATAWEIVKFYANSCFRPYGFEVEIGKDGPFEGMRFMAGDCEASIRGFIDRIDMAEIDGEKYINIVDYKSSVKDTNENLEKVGVQIQPLVYASVARDNLGATPSGMMYIHMGEPLLGFDSEPDEATLEKKRQKSIEIKGIILNENDLPLSMDQREVEGKGYIPHGTASALSREEMETRIKNAEEKAKETAEKIVSGRIEINPYNAKDYSACRYCKFSSVCGKRVKI